MRNRNPEGDVCPILFAGKTAEDLWKNRKQYVCLGSVCMCYFVEDGSDSCSVLRWERSLDRGKVDHEN